jgi:hypothetical protein
VAAADGQGLETHRERTDERQMAVDGQIGERAQDHEELPEHRRLCAVLRIDQRRETEAHGHRDALTGKGEGLERELHHHADGDPDQHLLHRRERAGAREDREARRHGGERRHDEREPDRQGYLDRARDRAFARNRRRQHEPSDAQDRPPEVRDPLRDVGGVEGDGLHRALSRSRSVCCRRDCA